MMSAASESKETPKKRTRHIQSMASRTVNINKLDAQRAMIDYLKALDVPEYAVSLLPPEFPCKAALEQPYLVTLSGHNVYKSTNCQNKSYVKQLVKEYRIGQKLQKQYIHKYPSEDIVVPDIQMLVLEQAVILMLVMNRVGTSAQRWIRTDPKAEDIVSVIEQIDRIHRNFLKLHFFHSDIKPHNILVRLGEKSNVQVSFCDFGLSKFFSNKNSNANIANRGTAYYKLSSYADSVKCNDYVIASTFQYAITLLSIYLKKSISRIWRCNHATCSALHIFHPLTDKSFLMSMMNDASVRSRQSRAACTTHSVGGRREGNNARNTRVKVHVDLCNVLTNTNACSVVLACRTFLQSLHIKDSTWTLCS
jgi:serine/threonine protein kinase